MIERYVFLKLKDDHATAQGRRAVIEHTRRVLASIPQVVRARVGEPADDAAGGSWDVSLAITFASIEDVEPYRVHPEHRRYVDEFLAPRLEILKAWSFAISPSDGGDPG